ncbi:hypothetical protein OMA37_000097 [Vibrio fluvialis]|nr:hypothetical protein [Vibrio fluvialis]EKO3500742.1 hypothetical protein [Vibrio fluvialis]
MKKFMLSPKTLMDPDCAEYFWINWMLGEKMSDSEIEKYIIKSFGGDHDIALTMINVCRGGATRSELCKLVEQKNMHLKNNSLLHSSD